MWWEVRTCFTAPSPSACWPSEPGTVPTRNLSRNLWLALGSCSESIVSLVLQLPPFYNKQRLKFSGSKWTESLGNVNSGAGHSSRCVPQEEATVGSGTLMEKNILALQAVNFSFPSAISTQNKANKANHTSEDAPIQDLEEIIRNLYEKKTRLLWKGKPMGWKGKRWTKEQERMKEVWKEAKSTRARLKHTENS